MRWSVGVIFFLLIWGVVTGCEEPPSSRDSSLKNSGRYVRLSVPSKELSKNAPSSQIPSGYIPEKAQVDLRKVAQTEEIESHEEEEIEKGLEELMDEELADLNESDPPIVEEEEWEEGPPLPPEEQEYEEYLEREEAERQQCDSNNLSTLSL